MKHNYSSINASMKRSLSGVKLFKTDALHFLVGEAVLDNFWFKKGSENVGDNVLWYLGLTKQVETQRMVINQV